MATTCLSEDSLRLVWGQRADLWSSRNFTNSLFPLLYCSVSFNAATFFHTLFLSFFPFVSTLKLNIPQQQIGGNGGTASVLHSIARFTVVFQCVYFFFLPMILGMFEAFWSHITDDMFCEYFHTVSFCNANGRDSVNKWKGRRMLNV